MIPKLWKTIEEEVGRHVVGGVRLLALEEDQVEEQQKVTKLNILKES